MIQPPFSLVIFVLFESFVIVSQTHGQINLFPAEGAGVPSTHSQNTFFQDTVVASCLKSKNVGFTHRQNSS